MIAPRSRLFEGTVVHKRLRPREHAFSYRVFAMCLDVDEIDDLDRCLRLFSRNRRNVLSFRDADLGEPGPDPVGIKTRRLLQRCGLSRWSDRIELVCYPRLFGYVFNPLSVYFCYGAAGDLGVMIYEVTNTFDERKSYVIPAVPNRGTIAQNCAKEMYVSPFTAAEARYGFHCIAPSERVVIGVNMREAAQPVLKTHFRGERRDFTDATILALVTRHPLMTLKVFCAIHLEAARLWAKGVPLVPHHVSPAFSYSVVSNLEGILTHA